MDRQVRKEIAFLSASFAIYSRASAGNLLYFF
jgi:hypothetical protein